MFKKYVLKYAKIRQLVFENTYNSRILLYLRQNTTFSKYAKYA